MQWDLRDPAFLADPAPMLARMRAAGPLVEARVPLIGRVWLTTTDEAARRLLKDLRFVRDPRGATGRSMAQTFWWLPRFLSPLMDNLITRDGEDHRRLRALVERAFARAPIDALEPELAAMADDLLDRIDPARPVDIVAAYARPLPLGAISAMLGVPPAERDRIAGWISGLSDTRLRWQMIRALPGLRRVLRHFRAEIAAARTAPRPGQRPTHAPA